MSQGSKKFPILASLDATAASAPSVINYRGEPEFATAIGGCCSAVAYLIILAIATVMFGGLIKGREFSQSSMITYIDDSSTPFEISAWNTIPVIRIRTAMPKQNFNITKYWVPVFSHYQSGSGAVESVKAVPCRDKF